MSKLTVESESLEAVANAIREKTGEAEKIEFPSGFVEKIEGIQGGEAKRSIKKYLEAGGTFHYQGVEDFRPLLEYSDTENLTNQENFFGRNSKLKYVPMLDFRKLARTYYMFTQCSSLVDGLPLWDLSNCGDFQGMFVNCSSLRVVPAYDMRSAWNIGRVIFQGCTAIEEIWVKNIPVTLSVGSGTSWGHLLTQESALHLCKECRNSNKTKTITFATPVYDNLEALYVKLVPITEEMRVEDDLIDEKLPFELCESTDDGAMTIASYMALKNWSIAK